MSLEKDETQTPTDYVLRGEATVALLKNAGETVSDNLLIVMILKRLPIEYQSFVTVTTQRKDPHDFMSSKLLEELMKKTLNLVETQVTM